MKYNNEKSKNNNVAQIPTSDGNYILGISKVSQSVGKPPNESLCFNGYHSGCSKGLEHNSRKYG